MQKLIFAYRVNPSIENANKIKKHDAKHPFASVLLAPFDAATRDVAIHHANNGSIASYQVHADAFAKHPFRS